MLLVAQGTPFLIIHQCLTVLVRMSHKFKQYIRPINIKNKHAPTDEHTHTHTFKYR